MSAFIEKCVYHSDVLLPTAIERYSVPIIAFQSVTARLSQKSPPKSSPLVLVIAGAALRCTDLCRQLRSIKSSNGRVTAKLFAKHIKAQEAVDFLKQHAVSFAVGTPGRIGKLLEETGESHETAVLVPLSLLASSQVHFPPTALSS